MKYNSSIQLYRGIKFQLIQRMDYDVLHARQYLIENSKSTIWLKEEHVEPDGTIIPSPSLDLFLQGAVNKLKSVGIKEDILKHFKS